MAFAVLAILLLVAFIALLVTKFAPIDARWHDAAFVLWTLCVTLILLGVTIAK